MKRRLNYENTTINFESLPIFVHCSITRLANKLIGHSFAQGEQISAVYCSVYTFVISTAVPDILA